MGEEKRKVYTGNRYGFKDPVTMSFVCPSAFRERIRRAAAAQDKGISDFIRDAIKRAL